MVTLLIDSNINWLIENSITQSSDSDTNINTWFRWYIWCIIIINWWSCIWVQTDCGRYTFKWTRFDNVLVAHFVEVTINHHEVAACVVPLQKLQYVILWNGYLKPLWFNKFMIALYFFLFSYVSRLLLFCLWSVDWSTPIVVFLFHFIFISSRTFQVEENTVSLVLQFPKLQTLN